MPLNNDGQYVGWAIVEQMGHRKLAGFCEPALVAGATMLRVDVPSAGDVPGFTTYVGGQSIFSMTPCDEQLARDFVAVHKPRPAETYSLERAANVQAKREFDRLHAQAGLPAPSISNRYEEEDDAECDDE